jgi:hypothetical protein
MTSIISILRMLDELIQQINNVKIYQEHFKLVSTILTQLRYGLNNTSTENG